MKSILLFACCISSFVVFNQSIDDLFTKSDVRISWLGIDFSHVKLIGDFSEFSSAGSKSALQVRDEYFPKWNKLILDERNKYDIAKMMHKPEIYYDIDMVMDLNANADVEELTSYNEPKYTGDDIKKFIAKYTFGGREDIGVAFIAETLNKSEGNAYYHFVAINMKTGELLIHERIKSAPLGVGLRNYWAGSIYRVLREIEESYYYKWKRDWKKSKS